MHQSGSRIRALFSLVLVLIIVASTLSIVATPAAFAEPPQATPDFQGISTTPTPQPTQTAGFTFRPYDWRRFTARMPASDVDAAVGTSRPPARVIAEGASHTARRPEPAEESATPLLADAPEGVMNIVLLGTDERPEWGSWRTDTIIVVSVNTTAESVGLLSIPRDLWIQIPGFGVGRINTVDFIGERKGAEGGGPGLLKRTIEANLGLPVHRYARINLAGFVQVIDALGGVTVDVECPVYDAFLDEPLTGEEELAPIQLDVGIHHLDGLTALRYARSRRGGTDFDRAHRQQKLLRNLAEQNLNWDLIPKLPRLWESLSNAIKTDLTLPELIQLASIGLKIQQNRIKSRFIDWRTTENWITAGGAYVLLPNHETLPRAVAEFLNPPAKDIRLTAEHARIEIQNGTTTDGLAEVAAKRLTREGFQVVSTAQTSRLSKSTILVYNDKPRTVQALQEILRLSPDVVVYSPEPDDRIDIRVILGSDWHPCD